MRCLYVSSESSTEWLIQKVTDLGWKSAREVFRSTRDRSLFESGVLIAESTALSEWLSPSLELPEVLKSEAIQTLAELLHYPKSYATAVKVIEGAAKTVNPRTRRDPTVLVIDSLNTVPESPAEALAQKVFALTSSGPRLIILIMDAAPKDSKAEFWEYTSDIVIRLEVANVHNYLVRRIEVLKARYQYHVLGAHQFKIYDNPRIEPDTQGMLMDEHANRAHPYREEGGVCIFPSVHYYLSLYKDKSPDTTPLHDPTGLEYLTEMLEEGLPRGRCTGFVGSRGGHKSHLGYHHVLSRLCEGQDDRAIIVSLRDDEGMATSVMDKILRNELSSRHTIDELESVDRLEILYYPPGCITPEEFYHRLYMTIRRMKSSAPEGRITLLFNSLDQLASRFPLCASERIFIPGIVETLSAENITSIFCAVQEPGQPEEQYGLLSMADLIVRFRPHILKKTEYLSCVREYRLRKGQPELGLHAKVDRAMPGSEGAVVQLTVERFAGGHPAGASGMLELVDSKESALFALYEKLGLHFVPYP
jgi:KaiC/GvpD/RAD55 family RecA-like ATPase